MVILLIANHIDALVYLVLLKFQIRRSNVLGDINAGAIASQNKLFVEPVFAQIDPNTAVGFAIENATLQAFVHHVFAQLVGVGFVIILIKGNTQSRVGFFESAVNPSVHRLPKADDFG